MQAGSERYVSLRGGLTVPLEPLLLVLDLEARGFRLVPDGDWIIVAPFSQLTDDEQQLLRRWKFHVLALLDYRAPEVLQ